MAGVESVYLRAMSYISHYHVLGERYIRKRKSTRHTKLMKAMNGVKAPLFLGVWENSWKEQQTFSCMHKTGGGAIVTLTKCTWQENALIHKLPELAKAKTLLLCCHHMLYSN